MDENSKTNKKITVKNENLLAETIYKPKEKTTQFAVKRQGKPVEYAPHVKINNEQILPLSPENNLVEVNAVRLPSRASEFEDKKELVKDIQDFIHQHLDISDRFKAITPYYILMTWIYDKFNEIPYLRTLGDFGSGKTRFLETIGSICYKPIFAGGSTTVSPIFRMMDKIGGTLILDEADYRFSNKTVDLIKVLNNGYTRGMPLMRTEGRGEYNVKAFDIFGPKIVASKERYEDKALESRFIVEQMGKTNREDIPLNLKDDFYEQAQDLRNKLLYWRLENYYSGFNESKEDISADVHPRLRQIALPLLTIMEDNKAIENLEDFFREHDEKLIQDRQNSLPGQVFLAVLKLKKSGYTN